MSSHFAKFKAASIVTAFLIAVTAWVHAAQEKGAEEKKEETRRIQKVNVVAERFNFTPSQIKVKEGTLLEIHLSSDDTFHGFRVASANINQIIPARGRGSVKVVFDAKEKGTYPFECSRPCGAGHTLMRGVIIVK